MPKKQGPHSRQKDKLSQRHQQEDTLEKANEKSSIPVVNAKSYSTVGQLSLKNSTHSGYDASTADTTESDPITAHDTNTAESTKSSSATIPAAISCNSDTRKQQIDDLSSTSFLQFFDDYKYCSLLLSSSPEFALLSLDYDNDATTLKKLTADANIDDSLAAACDEIDDLFDLHSPATSDDFICKDIETPLQLPETPNQPQSKDTTAELYETEGFFRTVRCNIESIY